jgi:hypothetical protein
VEINIPIPAVDLEAMPLISALASSILLILLIGVSERAT